MSEKPREDEMITTFEECWKALTEEYGAKRLFNVYCSEADITLHLASELLKKLPLPTCVYREFPIPFDVDDFIIGRMNLGRPIRKMKRGTGIVADIVVMGASELVPTIIAEVKFSPLIWNYLPILEVVEGKATEEQREKIRIALLKEVSRLESWEKYGPSQSLPIYYLKDLNRISQWIRDFKEKYDETVFAYLCVIDEIYPSLGQLLNEEARKHNPPSEFRLRFHHNDVKKWLEEQLSKL